MVDWTKPIQFRDGTKLELLCSNFRNGTGNTHVLRSFGEDYSGEDLLWWRDATGECRHDHDLDVVNVPVRVERLLHVFAEPCFNQGFRAAWGDVTKRQDETYAGTIRVEVEDGKIVAVSIVNSLGGPVL